MKMVFLALVAVTVVMSIVSFLLMRNDKNRARRGLRRIPERTLFLAAICFGAIGGTLGMQVFMHKTNHWNFRSFFPLLMIIQIAILGYLAYKAFA